MAPRTPLTFPSSVNGTLTQTEVEVIPVYSLTDSRSPFTTFFIRVQLSIIYHPQTFPRPDTIAITSSPATPSAGYSRTLAHVHACSYHLHQPTNQPIWIPSPPRFLRVQTYPRKESITCET
jgi:hypothetical protein